MLTRLEKKRGESPAADPLKSSFAILGARAYPEEA